MLSHPRRHRRRSEKSGKKDLEDYEKVGSKKEGGGGRRGGREETLHKKILVAIDQITPFTQRAFQRFSPTIGLIKYLEMERLMPCSTSLITLRWNRTKRSLTGVLGEVNEAGEEAF